MSKGVFLNLQSLCLISSSFVPVAPGDSGSLIARQAQD